MGGIKLYSNKTQLFLFTPVGCAKRKIIFHFARLQNLETKFLVDNCSDIQEDCSITPLLR